MQTPKFLNKTIVLKLHARQIEKFGGTQGIRDEGLLESALAQPQATFAGELLHSTIEQQAAAYLYHVAMNHPFIDGNKRTAVAVMEVFLMVNEYSLNLIDDQLYNLVMLVANSQMSKTELSNFLKEAIRKG